MVAADQTSRYMVVELPVSNQSSTSGTWSDKEVCYQNWWWCFFQQSDLVHQFLAVQTYPELTSPLSSSTPLRDESGPSSLPCPNHPRWDMDASFIHAASRLHFRRPAGHRRLHAEPSQKNDEVSSPYHVLVPSVLLSLSGCGTVPWPMNVAVIFVAFSVLARHWPSWSWATILSWKIREFCCCARG